MNLGFHLQIFGFGQKITKLCLFLCADLDLLKNIPFNHIIPMHWEAILNWSNESNFWCQRKRFLFSPHFHIQFQNFFMYWCKIYNGVRSERGMQSIKNCGFRKESVLCYGFPCSRFMAVGRGSIFAAGCQDIGIAAAAAAIASSSLLCERKSDLF